MTILLVTLLTMAAIVAWSVAFTASNFEVGLLPRGQFKEIRGQRIHYVDRGEGPAIVMICNTLKRNISARPFPRSP
jgi:hypothetical protein